MVVKTSWKIRFKCGHVETKDLSHKKDDARAGFARWIAVNQTCTPCWRKAHGKTGSGEWVEDKAEWLARKRATEQAAAEHWAHSARMPQLRGREKAATWATRVRYELMRQLYQWAVQDGNADAETYEWAEDQARSLDTARWWLDHREHDDADTDPETLLDMLVDATETAGAVSARTSTNPREQQQ